MATEQLANAAQSTLASNYTAGNTTLSLHTGDGSKFPSTGNFMVALNDPADFYLQCTSRSGDTLTVSSTGQEGTVAVNESSGTKVTLIQTAASIQRYTGQFCLTDLIANLPAAGVLGRHFYPQDSVYDVLRDNGSSWDYFFRGAKVTPPGGLSWSFNNQGSSTATQQTNGVLTLNSPSNGAADSIRSYEIAAPGTPWKRIFRFRPFIGAQNFNGAGLLLRESSSGKIIAYNFQYDDTGTLNSQRPLRWLRVSYYTNTTTFNATLFQTHAAIHQPEAMLRLGDDGTTITFEHSNDEGVTWFQDYSEARGAHFTTAPNKVGLAVNPNNASGSWANIVTLISVD